MIIGHVLVNDSSSPVCLLFFFIYFRDKKTVFSHYVYSIISVILTWLFTKISYISIKKTVGYIFAFNLQFFNFYCVHI